MVRLPSTAVGGRVASMPKKSQQACQKASMSVVDHAHIDSKSEKVRPRSFVSQVRNSVSLARAIRSGDGVHSTVPASIIPEFPSQKSALLKHDLRALSCPSRIVGHSWTNLNHWSWQLVRIALQKARWNACHGQGVMPGCRHMSTMEQPRRQKRDSH
jgi:hypothetical protein